MRLTTKFSAFITLLTSLTIFVTLIGASLSFYNGIENKVENRVQAVATMLDNRLITTSFDQLEPQLDELMTRSRSCISISCLTANHSTATPEPTATARLAAMSNSVRSRPVA